jgi:hypothetical protein
MTASATVAVAAVALATPSPVAAATGSTTLAATGPAATSLRERGVRIAPVKPAKGGAERIVMPLGGGLAGTETTRLLQRGGISLRIEAGRGLRLSRLSVVLGRRSRVEARLGGEEVELFRVLRGGRRDVDPVSGRIELAGLRLKLTRAAAGEISRRLGIDRLAPARFGTLSSRASGLNAAGSNPAADRQGEKATGCPLPGTAGPEPQNPLPPATRPAGATDVVSATVGWHVRESFVRYIGTGEGTSVSGGATADPPVLLPGASTALSYDFHFPFASGWLDAGANAADPGDDRAAVSFSGAVRFRYSKHEIDLVTASPEIEIAGPDSRAIFSISDSGGAVERQVLVNLDLGRAAAITATGGTFTYERVPGAIPSGTASSTFAGFYAPGTDFGCFTVSFSTAG